MPLEDSPVTNRKPYESTHLQWRFLWCDRSSVPGGDHLRWLIIPTQVPCHTTSPRSGELPGVRQVQSPWQGTCPSVSIEYLSWVNQLQIWLLTECSCVRRLGEVFGYFPVYIQSEEGWKERKNCEKEWWEKIGRKGKHNVLEWGGEHIVYPEGSAVLQKTIGMLALDHNQDKQA